MRLRRRTARHVVNRVTQTTDDEDVAAKHVLVVDDELTKTVSGADDTHAEVPLSR
jgi:hypothetical protein